jgi:hypothetical protein
MVSLLGNGKKPINALAIVLTRKTFLAARPFTHIRSLFSVRSQVACGESGKYEHGIVGTKTNLVD